MDGIAKLGHDIIGIAGAKESEGIDTGSKVRLIGKRYLDSNNIEVDILIYYMEQRCCHASP